MREVCPDCDTLMSNCHDPLDQNEEPCWHCPNCGETWTKAEMIEAYRLFGLENEPTDPNEY